VGKNKMKGEKKGGGMVKKRKKEGRKIKNGE